MNGAIYDGMVFPPILLPPWPWLEVGYEWPKNALGQYILRNDVWIGREADHAGVRSTMALLFGAAQVVSRDVPAYTIVEESGTNCESVLIGRIDRFVRIAWWNWD